MQPFTYIGASDPGGAVRACGPNTHYLAGGTNLLDLMKEGVERPSSLVDVTRLALTRVGPGLDQPGQRRALDRRPGEGSMPASP